MIKLLVCSPNAHLEAFPVFGALTKNWRNIRQNWGGTPELA